MTPAVTLQGVLPQYAEMGSRVDANWAKDGWQQGTLRAMEYHLEKKDTAVKFQARSPVHAPFHTHRRWSAEGTTPRDGSLSDHRARGDSRLDAAMLAQVAYDDGTLLWHNW